MRLPLKPQFWVKIISILIFYSVISITSSAFGQLISTKLQKADELFDKFAYPDAIVLYEEMARSGEFNDHIGYQLAESYRRIGNTFQAEYWYEMIIDMGSVDPIVYYYYAQALRSNKKNEKSEEYMKKYAELNKSDSRPRRYLENEISLEVMIADSNNVEVINLEINSENMDFAPMYYKDEIVFCSAREKKGLLNEFYVWDNQPFLDLYISDRRGEVQLQTPEIFSEQLNSKYHEGPVTFNESGNIIYFTRNNYKGKKLGKSKDKTNNLKIYSATLIGGFWGNIQEFPYNSDEYSCGHPALSLDGSKLYFASDMPGTRGQADIFVCDKQGNSWGQPQNLCSRINTEGNEMFPYLHQNGTLYFASDGLVGFGGMDIFYAKAEADTFGVIVNVGFPLNSSKDDFAMIIDEDEEFGYFSSNREDGVGSDDIYGFKMLYDDWQIVQLEEPTTVEVPENQIIFDGEEVELGKSFVLKNIYYDLDKWNIRPDAEIELLKVINFMKEYPNSIIELSSHTDCRNTHKYNMELSQKRAQSATDYIVEKGGIEVRRIYARGYGETMLVNECADGVECTEEQHQSNRRTEVTILRR